MTDRERGGILLVDDNASIRTMAALYLRSLGYRIFEAASGEDAMRTALGAPLVLILMDLNLSGMDGLEAARRIRALGRTVPIVGMTAADHDGRRRSCLDAGMDELVDKVGLLSALPEVLRRFVTGAASGAARSEAALKAGPAEEDGELDVAELNNRREIIGRVEMVRLFAGFSVQGRRTVGDLDRAWRDGRRGDAADLVHRLGGGAAMFQMVALHSVLARLEAALRRPAVDDGEVSRVVRRVVDHGWPRAEAAFERWLGSGS